VASAELECLGELLLFAGTLGRGAPTPGAALLNLRYRDERGPGRGGRTGLEGRGLSTAQRVQLGAYPMHASMHAMCRGVVGFHLTRPNPLRCARAVALTVVGKYVWARLGNHVAVSRWSQHAPTSWRYAHCTSCDSVREGDTATAGLADTACPRAHRRGAWRMLHTVDAGYNVASVVHFLHFLRHGVYRTLPERLVGARLVYGHTPFSQPTCFEHMNRELVWHELSELLLFVLPLLSAARLMCDPRPGVEVRVGWDSELLVN
jgi:peroxin-2